MRSPYLEDIPLVTAQKVFEDFLNQNSLLQTLGDEMIPLDEHAVGRVLSRPVYSPDSSPNFHASAMDGFAVISKSTLSAQPSKPAVLHAHEFLYLDTGDPLPDWADAVIPVENIEALDASGRTTANLRKPEKMQIRYPAIPWQNVRSMGEDIISSQLLFPRGFILRPIDLGALAACGVTELTVARKPIAAIIPTGTELVKVGKRTRKGELIEFNTIVLAGMVNEWGGTAIRRAIVEDDLEKIKKQITLAAVDSDLVLLNAGSSAGSEDYSVDAIEALGQVLVHGIAIRPGHPVILGFIASERHDGSKRNVPIIGVPGYPVSAALTAEIFVEPLIAKWTGRIPREMEEISARLTKKVVSPSGDTDLLRVIAGRVGGELLCAPLNRGAGMVTSLAKADGLVVIPPGSQGISAGERVTVKLYCSRKTLEKTIFAIGSHDITLDLLSQKLADHNLRLISSNVGSQAGLIALNRGEAHLAGTHLLDTASGVYNVRFLKEYIPDRKACLMHWVRREQGLIIQKGNPKGVRAIHDLVNPDISFINRQRGSGTRLLLDFHLGEHKIDSSQINGYGNEEYTHLGVAVSIASGKADCGLGIKAAAVSLGLDFIPLYYEQYDFALADDPERNLIDLLIEFSSDKEYQAQIIGLGGYEITGMGEMVEV